jgi:ankyrin repeat protein
MENTQAQLDQWLRDAADGQALPDGQKGPAAIAALLAQGADAKRPGEAGRTALMLAARRGDAECVKALLPVSDASALDHEKLEAFDHALKSGNVPSILALPGHAATKQQLFETLSGRPNLANRPVKDAEREPSCSKLDARSPS